MRLLCAFVTGVSLLLPASVNAEDFPARQIRLIVPFPAGGPSDIIARVIGQRMSEIAKQTVIIDNRGGQGGVLGTELLAKASPDGYTIAQIPITVFRLPLMQDVSWDPSKDFSYIVHLTGYTFGVTTSFNASAGFASAAGTRTVAGARQATTTTAATHPACT